MKRTPAQCGAAAVATLLLLPGSADAHGLVGKQDLPIPTWLFAWAASAVLVASFIGLAMLWRTERYAHGPTERRPFLPAPGRIGQPLLGTLGIAAFAAAIYVGFEGTADSQRNLLPTLVYVAFWVGIPVLSCAAGDVFRAINPWRAVGRATGWALRRARDGEYPTVLPYPAWLGQWPAALGIAAFAVVELASRDRDDPGTLAGLAVIYAAVQLTGMAIYGERAWTRNADAFSVYFRFFASLAPIRWSDRGPVLRAPVVGALRPAPVAGTVAVVCTMIGTTTFDGLSASGLWDAVGPTIADGFGARGASTNRADELSAVVGIGLAIAGIWGLYRLGCAGMHRVAPRLDVREIARTFAPSLIPIALAYVFAHYIGLLAYQGQALWPLLSDPLGDGSDLFGTASAGIDYGWLSANAVWYLQLAALLGGHVAGLLLAHDRALSTFRTSRGVLRSQYLMLGVMVTLTCLGLLLLSI